MVERSKIVMSGNAPTTCAARSPSPLRGGARVGVFREDNA